MIRCTILMGDKSKAKAFFFPTGAIIREVDEKYDSTRGSIPQGAKSVLVHASGVKTFLEESIETLADPRSLVCNPPTIPGVQKPLGG